MTTRDLKWLTLIVSGMVVIDALWVPVVLTFGAVAPAAFATYATPNANMIDGAALAFKLSTMIVFAIWIYRAGTNLVRAGIEPLEFSAASRIWWFFVPIMSLFRPFQAMREMWNASHSIWPYDSPSTIVAIWWALYLGSNLVGSIIAVSSGGGADTVGLWIASVGDVAVGVVAIRMINAIAKAQLRLGGDDLAEVFA